MKTSLKGRIEILGHEAIVTTRYKDSVGVWTIGVGVTAAAGAHINPNTFKGTITVKEAVEMFEDVLIKYERDVNRAIKVPLEQHQFDALVSFHYNTGGIFKAALTKKINKGNLEGAAKSFMGWVKPKEIIPRRRKEQALFSTGRYGSGAVNVYTASTTGIVRWSSGKRINALDLLTPKVLPSIPSEIVEVVKDADKPLLKSTQAWAGVGTTISGSVLPFITDWRVQIVCVAVIAIFGTYIIWERKRKADAARKVSL